MVKRKEEPHKYKCTQPNKANNTWTNGHKMAPSCGQKKRQQTNQLHRHGEATALTVCNSTPQTHQMIKVYPEDKMCMTWWERRLEISAYFVGPGVLIPGRKLQHSDDLIYLCAHLLKGEVSVFQGFLHTMTARCLGCHKDFDSWNTKPNSSSKSKDWDICFYICLSMRITWDEDGQKLFDCVHRVDQHHTVLLVCQLLLSLIYHLGHLCHSCTWQTGIKYIYSNILLLHMGLQLCQGCWVGVAVWVHWPGPRFFVYVIRSSIDSTTSATVRYSRIPLHTRIILRTYNNV